MNHPSSHTPLPPKQKKKRASTGPGLATAGSSSQGTPCWNLHVPFRPDRHYQGGHSTIQCYASPNLELLVWL